MSVPERVVIGDFELYLGDCREHHLAVCPRATGTLGSPSGGAVACVGQALGRAPAECKRLVWVGTGRWAGSSVGGRGGPAAVARIERGQNMLTHFRSCHRCRVAIWQVTGMALWLGTCIVAGVIIVCGDPRSLWFHAAGIYCTGSVGVALGLAKRWGKRQEEEEQPDALER